MSLPTWSKLVLSALEGGVKEFFDSLIAVHRTEKRAEAVH